MKLALNLLETAKKLYNNQLLFHYKLWDHLAAEKEQREELLSIQNQIGHLEIRFARQLTQLGDQIDDFVYNPFFKPERALCPKIQQELETLTPNECLEIEGCHSVEIECEVNDDKEYFVYFAFQEGPYERRFVVNGYDKNFLNVFLQALTKEDFEI